MHAPFWKWLLITLLVSVSASIGTASEARGKKLAAAHMAHYYMADALRKKARDDLFNQMDAVGQCLVRYRAKQGGYPAAKQEIEDDAQLATQIANNPFTQSHRQPAEFRLVIDPALTEKSMNQLIESPPDTWTATPGTITVVTNTYDRFIIWGAGADTRPIKNDNGKGLFVTGTVRRPTTPRAAEE